MIINFHSPIHQNLSLTIETDKFMTFPTALHQTHFKLISLMLTTPEDAFSTGKETSEIFSLSNVLFTGHVAVGNHTS